MRWRCSIDNRWRMVNKKKLILELVLFWTDKLAILHFTFDRDFFPLSPRKKQSFFFNSRNNRKYFRIVKRHYKKKVTVIMSLWPMPQNIHMHFITSIGVVTRTNVFYLTRTGILVTSRLIYWKNMLGNVIKR